MSLKPRGVNFLRARVGIGPIKENNSVIECAISQDAKQIILRSTGLCKDDRLLCRPDFRCLSESDIKSLQQRLAFSVVIDGGRQLCKRIEICNFLLNSGAISLRKYFDRL